MPENCPIDVKPYAQAQATELPKISNLNYTNQDFWSLQARLVNFINERFGSNGTVLPNTFNDFVESSVAIMLTEVFAFVGDTLSFKLDQQFQEMFTDSIAEPINMFRHANDLGFKPVPPIPSRSLWTATLNNPLTRDVIIPTPIAINVATGGDPITIELFAADSEYNPIFDDPIVIPAGSTINSSVVGLEGNTVIDSFKGTGEVGQIFQLSFNPVVFESIRVEVDGSVWNKVDYFSSSSPLKEYRVEYDSNYNAFLIFGNNRAGLIPSVGSDISLTYRVGGGTRGNIITGFVTTQHQASVDGLDFTVSVTLQNYTKGQYGYDGDGIEEIRSKLPAYLRTQDRAVTGLDYKTIADQFATPYHGEVGKSTVSLRNHGCAGNIIDVFVLAKSGVDGLEKTSNELKNALSLEFDNKKMITDHVCIKDGTIVSIDASIEVICDKFYRKFESEIREGIQNRVAAFFSLNNWEYGQTLNATDLIKQLSSMNQIKSLEISFVANDSESESSTTVTTRNYEIIRPDVIEITFMYE